jgi:CheY-like chemotaxis protein
VKNRHLHDEPDAAEGVASGNLATALRNRLTVILGQINHLAEEGALEERAALSEIAEALRDSLETDLQDSRGARHVLGDTLVALQLLLATDPDMTSLRPGLLDEVDAAIPLLRRLADDRGGMMRPRPDPAAKTDAAPVESAELLVVEDEDLVRATTCRTLRGRGYTVIEAASGDEAILRYRQCWREIDLVLLDMVMPGMSGSEVYQRLREINPDVRVLLVSGHVLASEAQTVVDDGARGFVQKPYTAAELADQVALVLGMQ